MNLVRMLGALCIAAVVSSPAGAAVFDYTTTACFNIDCNHATFTGAPTDGVLSFNGANVVGTTVTSFPDTTFDLGTFSFQNIAGIGFR
jgi:hypothetical protein